LTNKSGGRIYGDTVTVRAESVTNKTDAALEARLATEVHTLSQRAIEVEAAHRDLSTPSTSSSGFFRRRADLSKHLLAYRERIGQAEAAYDAQQRVVDGIKDELSSHPAGVIAAHSQLDVSANTIQNTGNALLYSGGDIALTAEETLKNSGARIEAQGSIAITAPHIENENAAFAAKRTITSAAVNPTKIRIDEPGHIEQGKAFPEWEFRNIDSGYGAYHSHIAKKPIYEHAAYEEIKQPTPAEIAAGEAPVPAELVGTLSPNYDYDDPIFKELGVASMSSPRPAHGDPAQAAWDAKYRIVLAALNEKIDAYNREAEEYNRTTAQAAGQKIDLLTFIETADVHSKETVTSSLPAAIRAGNNITLHGDTENTDSAISAGGTLRMDGALTENAHQQQEQTVTLGTTRGSYTERRNWLHRGKVRKFHSKVYMTPEVVRANPAPIGVHAIEENAAAESVSDAQRNRVARTLSPFGLASAAQTAGTGASGAEHLSISALYHVHPESTAKYLVETDPAFTDRKKFLSSDYMYQRLKWDPDRIPKRIGDGFYEQQLLADQILKQTGKRHMEGYTDDETAFRALMDAGISYAQEMNLAPGIKLSKEQVAALTSDMIWLEEREVEVNGRKERAVYPVLYTKNTNGLKLAEGGSLISARNIIVETKDALKNAGTLYGENILVQAGAIENTGRMRAKSIGLKSESDIHVQGSLVGDKKVVLEAKNNITVESTTEKLAHQDVLNTTAGIAVKGDEGVLVVSAGKNIALAGAALTALGKNGSVLLAAGENIALGTKKLQSEKDMTANAENYLRTKRSTELGTEIRADGNISLAAGNDLTARAATIESKSGTASLAAGNDISLTEGRETAEDHYGIRYKESGLLSTKTTTIRIDTESDIARTTNITGQNVNIAAKRDATFAAANIAADNDVNIAAGRNFSAVSAENYSHTENYKEVKKSGIFGSGGGLGFTIG
ncbi:S-layer family protein, partial [uncultured Selenomonas sp.]|uniref:S-layer family protein n=1 Tax=uncultured Selenomonas sp. TaxID=159275 RepID=UPI00345B1ED1